MDGGLMAASFDHQPAALSKDGRFFVQPTGTTSTGPFGPAGRAVPS
jgi:hypothetical protein